MLFHSVKAKGMDKKIEMFAGWDTDLSLIVGSERNHHLPYRCTVVVHQGDIERVFTESEARAIMGPLVALSSARLSKQVMAGTEYVEADNVEFAFDQLKSIAIRLGFYSDPA